MWYCYVKDEDNNHVITEGFDDANDAYNAANTWEAQGYSVSIYQGV